MSGCARVDRLPDMLLRDLDAYRTVIAPSWIEEHDVSSNELVELYDGVGSALRVARELHAVDPTLWERLLAQGMTRDLNPHAESEGAR